MTAPRSGRRALGRIIAGSLAVSAFTLGLGPAVALAATAAPAASAAPAQDGSGTGSGGSGSGSSGSGGGSGDDGGGSGSGSGSSGSGSSGSGGGSGDDGGGSGSGSGSGSGGSGSGSGSSGGSGSGSGSSGSGGSTGGSGGSGGGALPGRPSPATPRPDPQADARKQAQQQAQQQAEDEKKAAEKAQKEAAQAEEKRRKAAEKAARDAAERAEQAARARESWESRGRPHRMVTVRTDRVEVVEDGDLGTLTPRRPGTMTLKQLDDMIPNDWLTIDESGATLTASLVLTPGTTMEMKGDIPTVRLTGGPDIADAAAIYTGSGRLTLEGVTIAGVDGGSKQPLPFDAVGRPYIEVAGGGEFRSTDSTLMDLGMPKVGSTSAHPAVAFNPDSTGSLVRTTVQRGNTGVDLSRTNGIQLDGLTVKESEEDGLILSGDKGTRMGGISLENNGGNGMVVSEAAEEGRTVSGISTSGNGLYGVVVRQQKGTKVDGVTTEGDKAGGLRLNQATDVTVTNFTATDQPIGVFTHVGSSGIVLDGMKINGGRRGVVVEKSTTNLEMRNSTVEGSRVSGVNIGGKEIRVNGVQVTDAKAGVRIERGSAHVKLDGMTVEGGRDGVVVSAGTEDIVMNGMTANHVEDDAIRTESPGTVINGGTITGGTTGIDVAAAATISGVTMNGPKEGLHARSPELVRAENVTIDATDLGLNVGVGSPFVLANSSVHALEAFRGQFQQEGVNNFSLPPLNLLSAIGVPLILLAIVLEQVHSFRQRKFGGNKRLSPPAIPVGAG